MCDAQELALVYFYEVLQFARAQVEYVEAVVIRKSVRIALVGGEAAAHEINILVAVLKATSNNQRCTQGEHLLWLWADELLRNAVLSQPQVNHGKHIVVHARLVGGLHEIHQALGASLIPKLNISVAAAADQPAAIVYNEHWVNRTRVASVFSQGLSALEAN